MTHYVSATLDTRRSALGIRKFGRTNATTTQNVVWSVNGAQTFNDTAVALYVSSSNNSDTQTVKAIVNDGSGNESTVSVALTGQTQKQIGSGTYVRCSRAWIDDTTAPSGDVYIAESDDLTAGVPDTQSKIKAKIIQGFNQTQQASWHCPAGHRGYVRRWYVTGADNGKVVVARLWRKPWGKVARMQAETILSDVPYQGVFKHPIDVTAQDDWYITAAVTQGSGIVNAGFDVELWPL